MNEEKKERGEYFVVKECKECTEKWRKREYL